MRVRNKKTGEIINLDNTNFIISSRNNNIICSLQGTTIHHEYNSLSEFVNDWEECEEPKEYWYISDFGYVFNHEINNKSVKSTIEEMKSIGNYFLSREEAELVVRKLKAWKRLKDKGFRFTGWNGTMTGKGIEYKAGKYYEKWVDDIDLLFGGEE